jgi:transposase
VPDSPTYEQLLEQVARLSALVEAQADRIAELERRLDADSSNSSRPPGSDPVSYVHVACTEYLTLMHVGGRSAKAIDAGKVLPGFTGVLVRDGYAGYAHLPAIHAWCGAHLLRDLRSINDADPDGQV